MTADANYIPPAFEDSGLPQTAMVRKAYDLVKQFNRATGSARIMAEMQQDEEAVTMHLVAFDNDPRTPVETLAKQFSRAVAADVSEIRHIYDHNPAFLKSDAAMDSVRASFIAVALWDAEAALERYKDAKLDNILLATSQQPGKMVILQSSVGHELRAQREFVESTYLEMADKITNPAVGARLRQTLQAFDRKLGAP
ncbi:MAG: hypothetical protein JNM12_12435 [Alphaproteobacteria bacterium]|nr:hypothetical protein [Alphaproteobacteria bacterium]